MGTIAVCVYIYVFIILAPFGALHYGVVLFSVMYMFIKFLKSKNLFQ